MKGLVAIKIGMTRVLCPETGKVTPVTLLQAPEAEVVQVKTVENDGYSAAVIAAFPRKTTAKNLSKRFKYIFEVELNDEAVKKGDKVTVADWKEIKRAKLSGTSKGRGFSGVIKRHNFSRGPETHGSHHHREPGSVGMCAKPGRILKGKKMPGRYGNDSVTFWTDVVEVDEAQNLIAVKGAVPGSKNSFVTLVA